MRFQTWIVVSKDATGTTIDRAEFDQSNCHGLAPMDVAASYARTMIGQARAAHRYPHLEWAATISHVRAFPRDWPGHGFTIYTEE